MFWIFQVIMLATFVIIINQYQNRQYQNGDKLTVTDHVHSFVASAHCRCHQCTSPVVIIIITDIAIIIIITAILFVIIVFVVTFFH